MNITHQEGPKKARITYGCLRTGSLFRFVSGDKQDVAFKTHSGHVWLSDLDEDVYLLTFDSKIKDESVILLDHELIIKGEL